MRKPIFIDRDGVLNVDVTPYVSRIEHLQIFPYTAEALATLNDAGFDIFIVSNQQGVSLGITPPEELEKMTEAIQGICRPSGFEIRRFYHCTALDSERHPWRKPSPGMILAAQEEFGVDPRGAFLIGDKWSDIEAGARAGCRPLLVLSGVTASADVSSWRHKPERVFANLLEAVHWIVSQEDRPPEESGGPGHELVV